MQRDLVVVILYDSIYNRYKLVKMENCKYHELSVFEQFRPIMIIYNICKFTFLQFYTGYRYYRVE